MGTSMLRQLIVQRYEMLRSFILVCLNDYSLWMSDGIKSYLSHFYIRFSSFITLLFLSRANYFIFLAKIAQCINRFAGYQRICWEVKNGLRIGSQPFSYCYSFMGGFISAVSSKVRMTLPSS